MEFRVYGVEENDPEYRIEVANKDHSLVGYINIPRELCPNVFKNSWGAYEFNKPFEEFMEKLIELGREDENIRIATHMGLKRYSYIQDD